jgi:hypothetical protein
MIHVRSYTHSLSFTPSHPARFIPISDLDQRYLTDILLQFFLETEPAGYPALVTSPLQDLRLYLGNRDITENTRRYLVSALNSAPQSTIREQYRRAMSDWLQLVEELASKGIGMPFNATSERQRADQLAVAPWSHLFTTLGTDNAGVSDPLHPLNFIYRTISIPSLSLRAMLFPDAPDTEMPLATIQPLRFALSSGPLDAPKSQSAPLKSPVNGQINLSIACAYHDPWEDELTHRLNTIRDYMNNLTDTLADLQAITSDVASQVENVSNRITSFETTAAKLESSLQEIWKCEQINPSSSVPAVNSAGG